MKKNLKSFFKGFSLVELMISLIAISLISAAFVPIITKKLSSMGVTVGSFGGNGGGGGSEPNSCPSSAKCDPGYYLDGTCKCQPCSDPNCVVCSSANYCTTCNSDYEPDGNGVCQSKACLNSKFDDGTTGKPSKGCCESVGAVFVPASVTGTKDLCMMKYNAVDELYGYHPNYPKNGIQINLTGTKCTKSPYCCWQGVTAVTGNFNGNYEYASESRPACQQNAAIKICQNWGYKNTKVGSWRLLTSTEANNLVSAINKKTYDSELLNNLQLCDSKSDTKGYNKCSELSPAACNGASNGGVCMTYAIWTQTSKYVLGIESGVAKAWTHGADSNADSVRCVTEKVQNQTGTITNGEIQTYNNEEPRNQNDCPKGTLFINKKYLGGANRNNLCIMQYNAVDDKYPLNSGSTNFYHPQYAKLGVKVVTAGTNCSKGSEGYCCWKGGQTSSTTGTEATKNGKYSSSDRAMCQQNAAKTICENWNYYATYSDNKELKNQKWRLMTKDEADNLATYINADGFGTRTFAFFTKYLAGDGLQLCDKDSSSYGSNKCAEISTAACNGASNGGVCMAYDIWTQTDSYILGLRSGVASTWTHGENKNADSVRCVSSQVRNQKATSDESDLIDSNEPINGSCPVGTIFIDKKYTGTRNICMTTWNFADEDANSTNHKPRIGDNSIEAYSNIGIKMALVGTKQNCSDGKCCWRGNGTGIIGSSDFNGYKYLGTNRTMCQQNAARILCNEYSPDNFTGNPKSKWRLLTKAEAIQLASYINNETNYSYFLSKYLDDTGLQLCDVNSSSFGSNRCGEPGKNTCNGASNSGVCMPYDIWTQTDSYILGLRSGVASTWTHGENKNADSVRCVYDGADNLGSI